MATNKYTNFDKWRTHVDNFSFETSNNFLHKQESVPKLWKCCVGLFRHEELHKTVSLKRHGDDTS